MQTKKALCIGASSQNGVSVSHLELNPMPPKALQWAIG